MTVETGLILGSTTLACMALIISRQLFGLPQKRMKDSILSAAEQELVCAVADAFFPANGPIPVSGTEAGILPYFDTYVRRSQPLTRVLIRLLLVFLEMSPLLFGPKARRFSKLGFSEQITFLTSASTSTIYFRRVSFISMRAMMTMAYLADDRVAEAMNMHADTDPFGIGDRVLEVRPEGRTA